MTYNEKVQLLKSLEYDLKDVQIGNRRRNFFCTKCVKENKAFGLAVASDSNCHTVTLLEAAAVEKGQKKENEFHPTVGGTLQIEYDSDWKEEVLFHIWEIPEEVKVIIN